MYKIPKGELIPQTVENLQEIMAKDAEVMRKQHEQIVRLQRRCRILQEKAQRVRRVAHVHITELEAQLDTMVDQEAMS